MTQRMLFLDCLESGYLGVETPREAFTLAELEAYLMGPAERIRVSSNGHAYEMLVNQNASLFDQPVNAAASEIAGETILGNALLMNGPNHNDELGIRWRKE